MAKAEAPPSTGFLFFALLIIGQNPDAVAGFMTMDLYASLDEKETRFDDRIAWQHLVENLGFTSVKASGAHSFSANFRHWCSEHAEMMIVAENPKLLMPPTWY